MKHLNQQQTSKPIHDPNQNINEQAPAHLHVQFRHQFINQKPRGFWSFRSQSKAIPFSTDLDIEFTTHNGLTALFGVSGAGKTTILHVIAGLLKPDHGLVYFNDQCFVDTKNNINLPTFKRQIGYVFQNARLFPHLSVKKNLLYGAKNTQKTQFHHDFEHIIDLLDIKDLLTRMPADLSGGETQRIGIGRALLSDPKLILMDEPLASLDEPRKQEILPYLITLKEHAKIPIIYVTHQKNEIECLADHLILIEEGHAYEAPQVNGNFIYDKTQIKE